jgi:predicted nucleotidyltransferase
MVKINDPTTLIEFIRMENYLSELTGMKIDQVVKDALKPRIGKFILREVVTL